MTDPTTDVGPESITLRHLRALDAKFDQLSRDMARGFAAMSGHLVSLTGRAAGLEIRMTALDEWTVQTDARLARIERRLGLIEQP